MYLIVIPPSPLSPPSLPPSLARNATSQKTECNCLNSIMPRNHLQGSSHMQCRRHTTQAAAVLPLSNCQFFTMDFCFSQVLQPLSIPSLLASCVTVRGRLIAPYSCNECFITFPPSRSNPTSSPPSSRRWCQIRYSQRIHEGISEGRVMVGNPFCILSYSYLEHFFIPARPNSKI